MLLDKLFSPRPLELAGRALFHGAILKAREPALYQDGGVADTPEGRFELLSLHVALLLRRLGGRDQALAEARQAVFDAFVRNLDDGLREMGVGDLSVGKKMRRLAEAVFGRLKSLAAALEAGDPDPPLADFVRRTLLQGRTGEAGTLVAYIRRAESALGSAPTEALLRGELTWPPFRL